MSFVGRKMRGLEGGMRVEAGDEAGQAAEDDGVSATAVAALHGSRVKVHVAQCYVLPVFLPGIYWFECT